MSEKPNLFVASSSEQMQAARQIAEALKSPQEWTVLVWDGLFSFSSTYIESLEHELDLVDFAAIILTGDDVANVREKAAVLPRDNVLFELGLFIGRLGRPRCFFFVDGASGTQIASDLSGVKAASFYQDAAPGDPRKPSLRTVAKSVKEQMRQLGSRYKPSAKDRDEQERLWRFSARAAGSWWERMRSGEDDESALTYVTMIANPATNTPSLEGRAYGLRAEMVANWHSVSSGVALGDKPKINYRWEGEQDTSIGQTFGGHGVITFDNETLETGGGLFPRFELCTHRRRSADTCQTLSHFPLQP
jgi:hypothetical protein